MADTWLEESGTADPFGSYPDGEGYVDGDAESDWAGEDDEAWSSARRRAQTRQLELARLRRRAMARYPAGAGAPTSVPRRPTVVAGAIPAGSAIRRVDLEAKVQGDELRRALADQQRRASRAEMATVAGVVAGQVQTSFAEEFKNPWARAALSFAPLLLLAPRRRAPGFVGVATDPRVVGGAMLAGLVLAADRRAQSGPRVARVDILAFPELPVKTSQVFKAQALDGRGAVLPGRTASWDSTNSEIASVEPASGLVQANKPGRAFIVATIDGVMGQVALTVT